MQLNTGVVFSTDDIHEALRLLLVEKGVLKENQVAEIAIQRKASGVEATAAITESIGDEQEKVETKVVVKEEVAKEEEDTPNPEEVTAAKVADKRRLFSKENMA